MRNITNRVGADLKQTHERDQSPLLHKSLEIRLDGEGKHVLNAKGQMQVITHTKRGPVTLSNGVTKTPNTLTRKQRAKVTKAMMTARRAAE